MANDKYSISWKEYVDSRLDAIEKSIEVALKAKGETHKDSQWSAGTIIASLLALGAILIAFLKH